MKKLFVLFLLLIGALAGAGLYTRNEWRKPGAAAPGDGFVQIPHGQGAREIIRILQDKKIVANPYAAFAYVAYSGNRHKLQAGEYLFDHPMTIPEVIDKLAS